MCDRRCTTLLLDPPTYQPDTFNLFNDIQARNYWFPCFRELSNKFAKQAAASQQDKDNTAVERAEKFRLAYINDLNAYEEKAKTINKLTENDLLGIRELLELNDKHLRRFGFPDPWLQQKRQENGAALALFAKRIQEIDSIRNDDARWTELIRGVLAGNMFDWGAQAVTNILESDENFGLHAALDRIEKRPWLMDNLDAWLQRLREESRHKCAVIFVDNSGVDVLLGMLPFVRELLKRGTKVLLAANTEPSLNDVTSKELLELLTKCSCHCEIISKARKDDHLQVFGNGQMGPCLDMRTIPRELCNAIDENETDLLVIEGMGRALHTNLYAKFNCETLKLAVIKNKWLAQHLGGDTFAVMCKYETPTIHNLSTTTNNKTNISSS